MDLILLLVIFGISVIAGIKKKFTFFSIFLAVYVFAHLIKALTVGIFPTTSRLWYNVIPLGFIIGYILNQILKQKPISFKKKYMWIYIFCFFSIFTILITILKFNHISPAILGFRKFHYAYFLFPVCVLFSSRFHIEKIMKFLLFSLTIASIFLISEVIAIHFIGVNPLNFIYLNKELISEGSQYVMPVNTPFDMVIFRPFGVLLRPQMSGFLSAMGALIALGLLNRKSQKGIIKLLFLLNFTATLICLGKLAILGLFLTLFLFYILKLRHFTLKCLFPFLFLVILSVLFYDIIYIILIQPALSGQYLRPIVADLTNYLANINLLTIFIGSGYIPTYYSYISLPSLQGHNPINETQIFRLFLQIGIPMSVLWFYFSYKGFIGNYRKFKKTNNTIYLSLQMIILLMIISLLHYNVVFNIVSDIIYVYVLAVGINPKV